MRVTAFLSGTGLPVRRSPFRVAAQRARAPTFRPARRELQSATMTLVSPADAHAKKGEGWKHIDVRTAGEYSAARAPASVNVPFMHRGPDGMTLNTAFLDEVTAAGFDKADRIIVSCASGKRSARACTAMEAAGFANLVDMEGGMGAYAEDSSLPKEP